MALQCGITGVVNSGKTTIFNSLSNSRGEINRFGESKPNLGTIQVPDRRLRELEKRQKTERVVPTTMEIVDIPGLMKGGGATAGNRFLAEIRNSDALIHVVRCFDNDDAPHPDGSVNPVRDIENINLELQMRDLESVEKKIERLERLIKTGDKDALKGVDVLKKCAGHLGDFGDIRSLNLNATELRYVEELFLLTMKPVLYVCNVDQGSAASGNDWSRQVASYLEERGEEMITIAGSLEADIAELNHPEERLEFLHDAGLEEPGVNRLVRAAYSLLNLKTFFTIGPKEIRAWTIHDGMKAPEAAGVIHSDLERGFIRAEVMKYDDFIRMGSESACKEAGRFFVEGKNYVVEDGDIVFVRFNV